MVMEARMKTNEKKKTLAVLLFVLFLCSCTVNNLKEGIRVQDVTKTQKIILNIDEKRKPHSLNIKISGDINGNVTFKILNEEGLIKSYELPGGKIDKFIAIEWYNKSCLIEYIPNNVSTGDLLVSYEYKYIN